MNRFYISSIEFLRAPRYSLHPAFRQWAATVATATGYVCVMWHTGDGSYAEPFAVVYSVAPGTLQVEYLELTPDQTTFRQKNIATIRLSQAPQVTAGIQPPFQSAPQPTIVGCKPYEGYKPTFAGYAPPTPIYGQAGVPQAQGVQAPYASAMAAPAAAAPTMTLEVAFANAPVWTPVQGGLFQPISTVANDTTSLNSASFTTNSLQTTWQLARDGNVKTTFSRSLVGDIIVDNVNSGYDVDGPVYLGPRSNPGFPAVTESQFPVYALLAIATMPIAKPAGTVFGQWLAAASPASASAAAVSATAYGQQAPAKMSRHSDCTVQ